MAFSKVVLLVVFAVLLISDDVSAHRDLAAVTTATIPYTRGALGGNGGRLVCNRFNNPLCHPATHTPVGGSCSNNPTNRSCYSHGGNGGKGGNGGNGRKGGRGGHGPPKPETR